MNLIITNIGRRGYLVDFVKESPAFCGKVFVSDCDISASGLYSNHDGSFLLPRPADDKKRYINELIKVCLENEINLVMPIIDPEIYILSQYVEALKEKGIRVVVSDWNVLNICYNKKCMNDFLKKIDISFPETFYSIYELENAINEKGVRFPVILKPIYGSGSIETYQADTLEQVKSLFHEGMMIQKKVGGDEYGIDIFNSFEGVPLRCIVKKKISMRSGETDKSVSVIDGRIESTALKIAENLKHVANLDCDLICENGKIYCIDLNPRFGGGYPATHVIGVNLIDVLLQLCKGQNIEPCFRNYQSNILVMKEITLRKTVLKDYEK